MSTPYKIRFFFDWVVETPFWSGDEKTRRQFGYPIELEDLPLGDKTRNTARELSEWHDEALNWADPGGPLNWQQEECDRFNQAVATFLQQVRNELGAEFDIINEYEEMTSP